MIKVLTITLHGSEFECISDDASLWFSQKTIAKIFGITKQNVSLYTTEIPQKDMVNLSKVFSVKQVEGARRIQRNVIHFNIQILSAIAIRSRRYELHKEILREASLQNVAFDEISIRSRREWEFGKLMLGALHGITPVKEQHRFGAYYADFYLPEFNLVVEYDELHHERPKQRDLDNTRQIDIQNGFGVSVLRVKQDHEIQGLNEVLKVIIGEAHQA